MANPEERTERTAEVFRSFAEKRREWVSHGELALGAMMNERNHRRNQRSRFLNSVRDMLALDGTPKQASFRYRHRTSADLRDMEANGQVEHRLINNEEGPQEDQSLPPDAEDLRYRMVSASQRPGPLMM